MFICFIIIHALVEHFFGLSYWRSSNTTKRDQRICSRFSGYRNIMVRSGLFGRSGQSFNSKYKDCRFTILALINDADTYYRCSWWSVWRFGCPYRDFSQKGFLDCKLRGSKAKGLVSCFLIQSFISADFTSPVTPSGRGTWVGFSLYCSFPLGPV